MADRWILERDKLASRDLRDIWRYVSADNEPAANRLIAEIVALFEKTADFPHLGRPADWLVPDHRILTHGRYLLIYRLLPEEQVIELVRVVHSARNWPQLFNS